MNVPCFSNKLIQYFLTFAIKILLVKDYRKVLIFIRIIKNDFIDFW